MNILRSLFLIILVSSCTSYPETIEVVLRQAGNNRKELEKVLIHYGKVPADSLKLRAAEFLITNMPGKYSEYYDAPWNDVGTVSLRWTSSSNKKLVLDTYQLGEPVKRDDVTHITADYLISNIELAFKVWQEQPWGKYLPFDIFCEEILPYRISTEPLENWREKALASFADLYRTFAEDSTMTTVKACIMLNSILPLFRMDKDFPEMNYSQLMSSTRSTCDGMAALAAFSMRALGIPVTVDYTQKWTDANHGHTWNSVYDTSGMHISFMGVETNPNEPHNKVIGRPATKIYRRTFSIQNIYKKLSYFSQELCEKNGIDVTAEYGRSVDVNIPVTHPCPDTKYAYLTTLYETVWMPVGWGIVEQDTIHFSSVGKQALYMPVYYQNNIQTAACFPFWLDDDGNCRFLKPDTSYQELLVLEDIAPSENKHVMRMFDGRFEGANCSDFSDARLLHTIKEVRGPFFHSFDIRNTSEYRYLLYYSPDNSRCNVAELEFYNENNDKLTGKVIGTIGTWSNTPSTREKAFDGDPTTFFDADSLNNTWVGLELDNPAVVKKIRFLPRTEGNNIYENNIYELFYWDGQQWYLQDKQVSAGYQLEFCVPVNALFYLRNITTKKTGRCFMIQDGIQKWL